jgi:hypothetical protein
MVMPSPKDHLSLVLDKANQAMYLVRCHQMAQLFVTHFAIRTDEVVAS